LYTHHRGIAPEAETFIVRVFDDEREFYGFAGGTAYSTDLIAAATICKDWGAEIISASLGGSNYNEIEETFFKDLYYESGILTVVAAGNGGNTQNVYPAAYDGVLSVGAADKSLNLAKFSTWNPVTTDVLAPGKYRQFANCVIRPLRLTIVLLHHTYTSFPFVFYSDIIGVDILSTFKENKYATFSGTSMAAPHATGALALMFSYINKTGKNANTQDIFNALKHTMSSTDTTTADREEVSNDEADDSTSIGVIDAYAAIQFLASDRRATESRSSIIPPEDSSTRCANEVHLDISTDSKANEIYYRLKRLSDDKVIWRTRPNTLESNSKYSETSCLEVAEDCYQFDIRDKGGDGITDGGGIELFYEGHELYRGGDFGRGGILEFGDCRNGDRP